MRASIAALASLLLSLPASALPYTIDLLGLPTDPDTLVRLHGSTGDGFRGLPVAGGFDVNDDVSHHQDFAMASMLASPVVGGVPRSGAGEVYLVFGNGTAGGTYDTGVVSANILRLVGVVDDEAAGSELWMDDVTGDGLGDLLIARQNYTPDPARIGAGALTIVVGGSELTAHAATLTPVDLGDTSSAPILVTFVGANELDRLGIWMRTGDVTGDGIADIVVGADQTDEFGESHRGAVYVIQGGAHLAVEQTIDLADFGMPADPLPGKIARITPPVGSSHFHFGATCQIADLDGNGKAEVLVAAALNRSGAAILAAGAPGGSAHAGGGSTDGTLYIAWDDNFPAVWPNGFEFEVSSGSGSHTIIDGAPCNRSFGEEILGGLDYDDDGNADLFVGDIVGNCSPLGSRPNAGSGHVFYTAADLKGEVFDLSAPPAGLVTTIFYGGGAGDIAADTGLHGDFDGDGIADLAFSSPHADPLARFSAGVLHIFFGQSTPWPTEIDLLPGSIPMSVRVTEVIGANGASGSDSGDTLAYSAAVGDLNGDGRTDLITNEMLGNGVLPAAEDAGNLIILSGSLVTRPPGIPVLPPWSLAVAACLLLFGCRLLLWPQRSLSRERHSAVPRRPGR
jgi:hypothetical protein